MLFYKFYRIIKTEGLMHLTLFLIYLKNNILKHNRFSCWWEWLLAVHEVKQFHRSQSGTR